MIDTTYRDFYEIPGGAVELGEDPPQACTRECREELGMEIPVGRLLAIDHQSERGQQGDSTMYVYDGGSVEPDKLGSHSTADAEVAAIVLVEPADLDSVTIPRLAKRLRGALAARSQGTVYEATNGAARR